MLYKRVMKNKTTFVWAGSNNEVDREDKYAYTILDTRVILWQKQWWDMETHWHIAILEEGFIIRPTKNIWIWLNKI